MKTVYCRHWLPLLIVILTITVMAAKIVMNPPGLPVNDSIGYLSVAAKLHETGVFTDGTYDIFTRIEGPRGEGMFFGPLYPAFLAALMKLDEGFYQSSLCVIAETPGRDCVFEDNVMLAAQSALGVIAILLVYFSGLILGGRKSLAVIAALLVLASGAYDSFMQVMTEPLALPLCTLACLLAALSYKRKSGSMAFWAAIVLGLLALTRPSFVYLFYFAVACGIFVIIWALVEKREVLYIKSLAHILALFVLGYGLAVMPWVVRNGEKLGVYAISAGYAPFILAQRVVYNDMTWREWGASYIYFLPEIGVPLAQNFLPPDSYERFDDNSQHAFSKWLIMSIADSYHASGTTPNQLPWIIDHYILAHPVKHILVTISLAWRGIWIAGAASLAAIPVFAVYFLRALRRRDWAFIIFAFPGIFLLGFNAFVSLNITRYNMILWPAVSIAMAWTILWLYDRYLRETMANVKGRICFSYLK